QTVADIDASIGRGDHDRGGAEAVVPVAHQAALANGLMKEDAISAARHQARRDSPGKTEARPEVVTVGLPLPAAHAADPEETQAAPQIKPGALREGMGRLPVEGTETVVTLCLRRLQVPAQADIDRQTGRHAKIILRIQTEILL